MAGRSDKVEKETPVELEDDDMSFWQNLGHFTYTAGEKKDYHALAHAKRLAYFALFGNQNSESKKIGSSQKSMPVDDVLRLKRNLLESYAAIVDSPQYLNNYAEEINRLIGTHNSQSARWKSTFCDMDDSELLKLIPESLRKPLESGPGEALCGGFTMQGVPSKQEKKKFGHKNSGGTGRKSTEADSCSLPKSSRDQSCKSETLKKDPPHRAREKSPSSRWYETIEEFAAEWAKDFPESPKAQDETPLTEDDLREVFHLTEDDIKQLSAPQKDKDSIRNVSQANLKFDSDEDEEFKNFIVKDFGTLVNLYNANPIVRDGVPQYWRPKPRECDEEEDLMEPRPVSPETKEFIRAAVKHVTDQYEEGKVIEEEKHDFIRDFLKRYDWEVPDWALEDSESWLKYLQGNPFKKDPTEKESPNDVSSSSEAKSSEQVFDKKQSGFSELSKYFTEKGVSDIVDFYYEFITDLPGTEDVDIPEDPNESYEKWKLIAKERFPGLNLFDDEPRNVVNSSCKSAKTETSQQPLDRMVKKLQINKREEKGHAVDAKAAFKSKGIQPSVSDMNRERCLAEPKRFTKTKEDVIRKRQKLSGDDSDSDAGPSNAERMFKTAKQMIEGQNLNKKSAEQAASRKCLGTRRGPMSKYVAPFRDEKEEEDEKNRNSTLPREVTDSDHLKNIDPKMVEIMLNEIMDHDSPTAWDDIAGLEFVKKTLKEIVVWPILRPDIFKGLRGPPKGILLFGPPGTGKTLIGKCVASQSKSTFFSISASSLGSKWVGEGEKLVRALFAVARCYQPAVIFIDEIDSLLTQRSDTEHESSRRIKTEFLVQFDGVKTESEEKLLIVGATNRPQELDEAARRRLVKRLYIPLPEAHARKQIIQKLMAKEKNELTESDIEIICEKTDGYSGADMTNLCKEASLGPIRAVDFDSIAHISPEEVRPIILNDFLEALNQVKASVSDKDLGIYEEWNKKYGSCHES